MDAAQIEKLVDELMQFDPSLNNNEADLRSIVALIVAKQPHIEIDTSFRETLRERILAVQPQAIVSPYAKLSWWAVRLAPIGAVALLILTLIPGGTIHAPTTTVYDPSPAQSDDVGITSTYSTMDAPEGTEGEVATAPSVATQDQIPSPSLKSSFADDSSMMRMESVPQEPLPFSILAQLPGMSVTVDTVTTVSPSFIVVYRTDAGGNEQLAGISPLIMPGTTKGVPVYLRQRSHIGEYYTASLVSDNGNRIFTEGEDMVLYDSYGNPYTLGFEIVSGYFE